MPRKSKNQIANQKYGEDFDSTYLSAGEKAAVTRAFNAQASGRTAPTSAGVVKATIGRVGVNGSEICLLSRGATVGDLVEQSKFTLDAKKEQVLNEAGNPVDLSDLAKHNETYAIAVEIKSARV